MQSVFLTLTTVVFASLAFLISHQNELKVPPRFALCISDPEVVIVVIEFDLED